jgi:hypothetical protein
MGIYFPSKMQKVYSALVEGWQNLNRNIPFYEVKQHLKKNLYDATLEPIRHIPCTCVEK